MGPLAFPRGGNADENLTGNGSHSIHCFLALLQFGIGPWSRVAKGRRNRFAVPEAGRGDADTQLAAHPHRYLHEKVVGLAPQIGCYHTAPVIRLSINNMTSLLPVTENLADDVFR
ncbi:hypothetical protein SFIMM107S_02635 [Streptomyces griseus]